MNDQIKIMEEMVQRTELNLQQMQALLAEAKANHVSSKTLSDETIRRIAEELANNFKRDMYIAEMVEMDTSVSGMEISVELDWDYRLEETIREWACQTITSVRDEC
jgi:uncharacterized protein YpuA (DUF1002 family)